MEKFQRQKNQKSQKVLKKMLLKKIKHQDYLDRLQNNQIMKHKMNTIRSDHHVLSSYQIKTILSCYDDKRYILDDGISSLAYGHYSIDKKSIDKL